MITNKHLIRMARFKITVQQMADLWSMRFDNEWVEFRRLDESWRSFYKALKRCALLDYRMINDPHSFSYIEVARLKGECNADH